MTTTRTRFFSIALAAIALALMTFAPTQTYAATSEGPGDGHEKDIVDTAVEANFNTLVTAVKAAGLVETLKGDGPFTVFAPTDEAFAKLPAGTLESLLMPENRDQLVAILTYHVVPGRIESGDLLKVSSAETVNGQRAPIGLRVGGATVIQADVEASNGIVHIIDTVLLPE